MNHLKKEQLNSLSCVSPDYLIDLYKNKLRDSTNFNPDVPKNTISHQKLENEFKHRMLRQPEIDNNDYTDVKDMDTIKDDEKKLKETFDERKKETFDERKKETFDCKEKGFENKKETFNGEKKETFDTIKESFNLSSLNDIFNNVFVLKIIIYILLFILFFSLLKVEVYKYKLKLLKKSKDKKKK